MSFPLPQDVDFIKEVVGFWLDDVDDRLQINQITDAEHSWRTANSLYLSLPAGYGDIELEDRIYERRVKLDNTYSITNENNL
jgi:hypothetical protein